MNANQVHALILLVFRCVTVFFIYRTMMFQIALVKQHRQDGVQWLRKTLLGMTVIALVGNFVPITIDTLGLFKIGSFDLLLAYVYSNAVTALLNALVTWFAYKRSGQ